MSFKCDLQDKSQSQRLRLKRLKGFSLIEVLMSMAVLSFIMVVAFASYLFFSNLLVNFQKMKDTYGIIDILSDHQTENCSIGNSILSEDNAYSFSCLKTPGLCKNIKSKLSYVPYLEDAHKAAQVENSKEGDLTISSSWSPVCADPSCLKMDMDIETKIIKKINAEENYERTLHLYRSGINYPAKSCSELKKNGYTQNGIYYLDPDGLGGDCGFNVYCDMSQEGWALMANAPSDRYKELTFSPLVQPGDYSVLNTSQIQALIKNSPTLDNNIKVEIEYLGVKTISMYTKQETMGQKSIASLAANNCTAYSASPQVVVHRNANFWGFYAGDGDLEALASGFLGFIHRTCDQDACFPGHSGYLGFFVRLCSADTPICGISGNNPCLFKTQAKGSVWIR